MSTTETDAAFPSGDAGPSRDIASIVAAAVMGLSFAECGNEDVHAHRHGLIQEAVEAALQEAGACRFVHPRELTPDLAEVLGLMIFHTGPMAHAFRDAGRAEIPKRCEDEQAFILHWLIGLVLEYGPDWRRHASAALEPVIAEAEAARTDREAARSGHG